MIRTVRLLFLLALFSSLPACKPQASGGSGDGTLVRGGGAAQSPMVAPKTGGVEPAQSSSPTGAEDSNTKRGEMISPTAVAPMGRDTTQPSVSAPVVAPAGFAPQDTLPYLASDQLEGRGVGTRGLDQAADFLASHFASAGLKPLPGETGFFQTFDYTAARAPSAECALTLAGKTLKLNDDYRPMSFSGEGRFTGDVVFAGYGVTDKKRGYDDYAGLDVRGKVVLAMRFEPMDAGRKSLFAGTGGADWSGEATFDSKARNAADHGAAALLLFTPPGMEPADPLVPFSHAFKGGSVQLPVIDVKRTVAALVLGEGIKLSFDKDGKPSVAGPSTAPSAPSGSSSVSASPVAASGDVRIQRTIAKLRNVVGMVPGSGPRADEYVIVGAHYDHLGKGQLGHNFGPVGSIYHGADDNASGTSAVLELAARAAAGEPRQRAVVFALFTAEEEGLIGSAHFVAHPPIPLEKVAAMLNMDMVGRVKDQTLYVGGTGTARDLDSLVEDAAKGQPLKVKPMPSSVGGRGGLGPSDHMSFALQRVPVVFLFTGLHADYHRPTDTSDKVNYQGIEEVAAFAGKLLDELAGMPKEPYDTAADVSSMTFGAFGSGDHTSGAALGVIPDYATETTQAGVLIQGARPGSAADKAGLQAGDIITQFGEQKLTGLQELADCLAKAKPGDQVNLAVQRGKQSLTLHATLTERK